MVGELNMTSSERMREYYPDAIRRILEFQALLQGEGVEIDILKDGISISVNEAYLTTMSEDRISEWEKALGIAPSEDDTIQDRRDVIIARIRGQGKLNTALINSIVGAFTEGVADSYIQDGVLHVDITPPPNNKQDKFKNVESEISKKSPVHLGLSVKRNYATWGEVKDNFADWSAIKSFSDWNDLVLYVVPQK